MRARSTAWEEDVKEWCGHNQKEGLLISQRAASGQVTLGAGA